MDMKKKTIRMLLVEPGGVGVGPERVLASGGMGTRWSMESEDRLGEVCSDARTEMAKIFMMQVLREMPRLAARAVMKLLIPEEDWSPEVEADLLRCARPFMDDFTRAGMDAVNKIVGGDAKTKDLPYGEHDQWVGTLGKLLMVGDVMDAAHGGEVRELPDKIYVHAVREVRKGEGDEPDEMDVHVQGYRRWHGEW